MADTADKIVIKEYKRLLNVTFDYGFDSSSLELDGEFPHVQQALIGRTRGYINRHVVNQIDQTFLQKYGYEGLTEDGNWTPSDAKNFKILLSFQDDTDFKTAYIKNRKSKIEEGGAGETGIGAITSYNNLIKKIKGTGEGNYDPEKYGLPSGFLQTMVDFNENLPEIRLAQYLNTHAYQNGLGDKTVDYNDLNTDIAKDAIIAQLNLESQDPRQYFASIIPAAYKPTESSNETTTETAEPTTAEEIILHYKKAIKLTFDENFDASSPELNKEFYAANKKFIQFTRDTLNTLDINYDEAFLLSKYGYQTMKERGPWKQADADNIDRLLRLQETEGFIAAYTSQRYNDGKGIDKTPDDARASYDKFILAVNSTMLDNKGNPVLDENGNQQHNRRENLGTIVDFNQNLPAIKLAQYLNDRSNVNGLGNERVDYNDLTTGMAKAAIIAEQDLYNREILKPGIINVINKFAALYEQDAHLKAGTSIKPSFPKITPVEKWDENAEEQAAKLLEYLGKGFGNSIAISTPEAQIIHRRLQKRQNDIKMAEEYLESTTAEDRLDLNNIVDPVKHEARSKEIDAEYKEGSKEIRLQKAKTLEEIIALPGFSTYQASDKDLIKHIQNANAQGIIKLDEQNEFDASERDLITTIINFSFMVGALKSDAKLSLVEHKGLGDALKNTTTTPPSDLPRMLAAVNTNTVTPEIIEEKRPDTIDDLAARIAALKPETGNGGGDKTATQKKEKALVIETEAEKKAKNEAFADIKKQAVKSLDAYYDKKKITAENLTSAAEKRIQELFGTPWVKGRPDLILKEGPVRLKPLDGGKAETQDFKIGNKGFKLGPNEGNIINPQNHATYVKLLMLHNDLEYSYFKAIKNHSEAESYIASPKYKKPEFLKDIEDKQRNKIQELANNNTDFTVEDITETLQNSNKIKDFKDFKGTNLYQELTKDKSEDSLSTIALLWTEEVSRRAASSPEFEHYSNGLSHGEYEAIIGNSRSLLDLVGTFIGKLPGSNSTYAPANPHKPWQHTNLDDNFFSEEAYHQYKHRHVKIAHADPSRGIEEEWQTQIEGRLAGKGDYLTKGEFEAEALKRFVEGAVEAGVAKEIEGYGPKGKVQYGKGTYWDGETLYSTENITKAMHGLLKDENENPIYYNPPYRDVMIAMAATRTGPGNIATQTQRGDEAATLMFGGLDEKQLFQMGQRFDYFDRGPGAWAKENAANPGYVDKILAQIKTRSDGPFHYFSLSSSRSGTYNFEDTYEKHRHEYAKQVNPEPLAMNANLIDMDKLNSERHKNKVVELQKAGNEITDDKKTPIITSKELKSAEIFITTAP